MAASGKWTCYHLLVFILTFFSYAFFHATRKAFSNIKDTLRKEWTPYNKTNPLEPANVWQSHHFFKSGDDAGLFLGAMDTTFLSTYAMGLFISGIIGDRYNLRKVLSLGMCLSAIMVFMFGTVSKWLNIHNIWYYGIFMALNGICQSAGWPSAVAIMGNWFGKSSRGLVFGIWSACASVGNIFGSLEAAAVLKYGYEYSMMLPSVILFAGGIIIFFCLTPSPTDIGLPLPVDEDSTEEERQPVFQDANSDQEQSTNPASNNPYLLPDTLFDSSSTRPKEPKKAIGFCTALFLPGVISFSLSYACLKLVNYSFFFWLPYYLSYGLKIDDTISDELSTFYDVGGIFGGAIAGLITDRMRSRLPVVATMLILSIGSLFLYYHTSADYTSNAAVMTLTGFMIGGPANLISSAISADLGRQSCLKGNSEALATVTGIVDGTGSVGAAIGQIMIPILTKSKHKETSNSWKYVFYFLMVMTFLSFVCIIIPPIVARIRKRRENQDEFLEPSPRTVNTATPDTWK